MSSSGSSRRRAAARTACALLPLLGAVAPSASLAAQGRPRLEVSVPAPQSSPEAVVGDPTPTPPPASDPVSATGVAAGPATPEPGGGAAGAGNAAAAGTPAVRAIDLLADGQTRDLMRNGFPARLHFRLDLWTASGVFNKLEGSREWDVVARYEPLTKHYRAARIASDRVTFLGDFAHFPDLAVALAEPYDVALVPPRRGGRYYYNAVVDVEMLSLRDLDEVERWLRGDLRPAIHGERNPGTAMTDGLRTLFLRLIGAERRHYEARSKPFTAG